MTETNHRVVITPKQAHHTINITGVLCILFLLFVGFSSIGLPYFMEHYPAWFETALLPELQSLWTNANIQLVLDIAILLVLALVVANIAGALLKLKMRDYLKRSKISLGNLILCGAIGIGIQLIAMMFSYMANLASSLNTIDLPFLFRFTSDNLILENVLYLLYVLFIQPICIEYIFRGVILRNLSHFGSLFGIITSSLLYALCQSNPLGVVTSFAFGLVLSVVTLRYHSLRPTIEMNIASAIFFLLLQIIPTAYSWVAFLLVGLVLFILFLGLIGRRYRRIFNVRANGQEKTAFGLFFTSWSTIVLLLLVVVKAVLFYVL